MNVWARTCCSHKIRTTSSRTNNARTSPCSFSCTPTHSCATSKQPRSLPISLCRHHPMLALATHQIDLENQSWRHLDVEGTDTHLPAYWNEEPRLINGTTRYERNSPASLISAYTRSLIGIRKGLVTCALGVRYPGRSHSLAAAASG